ncbi:MAG: histidine phosphatase family protein [Candidatus Saccharimonadales bacterium]
MQIIVIRHASTEYNNSRLINGQHDESLSPEGHKELPGLVKKLKAYDFNIIYSSPLKRAVQTALPIAEARDLQINIDRRLIEVDFGIFTAKNWESLRTVFGVNSSGLLDSYNYDLKPYGGESAKEVEARIQDFLNDLLKSSGAQPLIVTHGGIIRWFYLLLTGNKTTGHPNSSIHVFNM